MRSIRALLAVFFFTITLFVGQPAHAVDVVPYDPSTLKTDSPIIISGYAFHGPRVNYVQLFNTSDHIIDLTGWRVEYTITGQTIPVKLADLHGLLKPTNYGLVADTSFLPAADFTYALQVPADVTAAASSIAVQPPDTYLPHTVTLKADTHSDYWQRNISTATGNFLSTFSFFVPTATFVLYGNGLYEYPSDTNLEIAEILPSPRTCSPLETDPACCEYIKLHNPTDKPIDLSLFRLRSGAQGQSATASNTFGLVGMLDPGHFVIVSASTNQPVSLTNTGSFVWIEDSYGAKRYDSTVVEYPDASSDSKKGQAWAYDSSDGQWKWTAQPMPSDQPSVFPPVVVTSGSVTSTLVPCREDQYRSEETNRCRSLASLATASLTPCADDEERNLATNRCRKLASATSQLVPCAENQERNPDTNRCRNVASSKIPDASFAVQPIKDTAKAFAGWWVLGGLGIVAVGYGAWEWRREMLMGIRKVSSFFTSGK